MRAAPPAAGPVAASRRAAVLDLGRSPRAVLNPVPLDAWKLDDAFWSPRLERNRRVTLPAIFEQLRATGRLDNFRRAAGETDGPYAGREFNDSDVYKWLEAACWALAAAPDPDLAAPVEAVVDLVLAAQRPDGYLNTYLSRERVPGPTATPKSNSPSSNCSARPATAATSSRRKPSSMSAGVGCLAAPTTAGGRSTTRTPSRCGK